MNRYHAIIKKSSRSIRVLSTLTFTALDINEANDKIGYYLDIDKTYSGNRKPYVRIIQL